VEKLSVRGENGLFQRVKFNKIRHLLVSETWPIARIASDAKRATSWFYKIG